MAVVKRRMIQLLPEISIFLDVDDLEEVSSKSDASRFVGREGDMPHVPTH